MKMISTYIISTYKEVTAFEIWIASIILVTFVAALMIAIIK